MCNVCDCSEIWYADPWVSHGFNKDQSRMIVDLLAVALWVVIMNPFDRDSKAWENAFKQTISTTIEVYRADDIVSCVDKAQQCLEDGGLSRCTSHSSGTSFKGSYPLFEYLDCGLLCSICVSSGGKYQPCV